MKPYLLIWTVIIIFFSAVTACQQSTTNTVQEEVVSHELIGAWQFMHSESQYVDTVIILDSTRINSIYIINKDHFSFTSSSVDSQKLLYAGYGRYSFDPEKGEYIENVEFHSSPDVIGLGVKFRSTVIGDSIWIHEGEIPLDDNNAWQMRINKGRDQYTLREYRKRLK